MKLYDVIVKEEGSKLAKKTLRNKSTEDIDVKINDTTLKHWDEYNKRRTPISRKIFILFTTIAFIILIYVVGIKLVHAKVVITPREVPFTADKIKIELLGNKGDDDKVATFQTMVISGEVTREVFGGDLRTSVVKAKGKVTFFNEYSKSSISIKAKTTLTGENGKKYTTDSSVTVAGYTTKDGKKVPGTSTSVSITANEAGPSYNSDGMNFTVSGYAGTKAKQFYAQSAGAISGGENGNFYTVSDKDKASVLATLQTQLTEKLKRETRAQIPSDFVVFPNMQFITIDSSSAILHGPSIKFPATLKGTIVSYLIPRSLLEIAIAGKVMSDHSYGGVSVPNIGDLKVEPVTAIPTDPKSVPDAITISVSGTGKIITKIPTDNIKDALLGIKKGNFSAKLKGINEIDTAKYNLYPFWSPFFPHDLDRLRVVVE